jgi:hypothetical protein
MIRGRLGRIQRDQKVDAHRAVVQAFSLAIGNHFIAADHGAHSRADVLELAIRRLLA